MKATTAPRRAMPAAIHLPMVTKAELLEAIQQGVENAIWLIANGASGAAGADFFAAIEAGVREAHERVAKGVAA